MKTLLEELARARVLMELRSTGVRVKMKQGVPYRDATAPPNGKLNVFTGNESGVQIADTNMNSGGTQIQLDDGRLVLTTDDAVDDTNITQDQGSLEANDINDSGMNNSL